MFLLIERGVMNTCIRNRWMHLAKFMKELQLHSCLLGMCAVSEVLTHSSVIFRNPSFNFFTLVVFSFNDRIMFLNFRVVIYSHTEMKDLRKKKLLVLESLPSINFCFELVYSLGGPEDAAK